MHQEYLPVTLDGKLAHLQEECAEVIITICKIQRFGLFSYNPLVPIDEREENVDALEREIEDLRHAIAEVQANLPKKLDV